MAKDFFHEAVKAALIDDGWTITHDPYTFGDEVDGKKGLQVDLGAERIIAATRDNEKIAIEVKSFLGASNTYQFHQAAGQYINYRAGIMMQEPDRKLYLAMPKDAFDELQEVPMFVFSCEMNNINLLIYDLENDTILSWKS